MYSMVCWMSFGMGLLLNAFLILLIRKRSVKEMKRYNIMLLQTCVLDIYALVVSAIVQPVGRPLLAHEECVISCLSVAMLGRQKVMITSVQIRKEE